jgi:peptide/nickel transport system ATP-binding protein
MVNAPLLEICDLAVEFKTRYGLVRIIDGLDFHIHAGETLGIVGESGCGKSMTALSIMRLVPSPPGRIAKGEIRLRGRNLLKLSEEEMRSVRGREISMVFQEPMTSLNPVYTVGNQVAEALSAHTELNSNTRRERVIDVFRAVGIPHPERRVDAYPHQLSGGLRQRVMIAMALICESAVLICDEPSTALDVTVQAQILDLLRDLQDKTGTAIILITHDMGVIAEMADRVLVLYAGRKVEDGPTVDVITNPIHPYTSGLINCVPHIDETPNLERQPLPEIPGIVPALTDLGKGCVFRPRCPLAQSHCKEEVPPLIEMTPKHEAACWVAGRERMSK